MGMFNNLMSKIFGHAAPQGASTPAVSTARAPSTPAAVASSSPLSSTAPVAPAAVVPSSVDVTAILDSLAAKNPEKLDWKKSIVDLLKLVGMDSSLSARKELATELNFSGDQSDSAAMNIWLHKQVLKKLSENGGKVPSDLLD